MTYETTTESEVSNSNAAADVALAECDRDNKEWIERAIEEYSSDEIAVDANAEVSVGDEGVRYN